MLVVPFVTTWEKACGIAEHAYYLREAVHAADPNIELAPVTDLHPRAAETWGPAGVVVLNYQAALLSQWTPSAIRDYRRAGGSVIAIYHDTGVPNTDQCKDVVGAADVTIIHEPATDLLKERIRYWRMGVPGPAIMPYHFSAIDAWTFGTNRPEMFFKSYANQPVVGTIGFPFGWKRYDQLVETAASVGWAVLLIAPGATEEQVAQWKAVNPDILVRTTFTPRNEAIALLSGCDATAFLYVTNNGGQSGAILQGIAARKPVIAFHTCRQFRALFEVNKYGSPQIEHHPIVQYSGVRWCESFADVASSLRTVPIGRVDPGVVDLAERESWKHVGRKYAALIRDLADGKAV